MNHAPLRECPQCQSKQAPHYAFCGACGCAFVKTCGCCFQQSPLYFKFCGYCGVEFAQAGERPVIAQPQTSVAGAQNQPASDNPKHYIATVVTEPASPVLPHPVPEQAVESDTVKYNAPDTISQQTAPLMASAVARMSERRRVAILFCDICGFTAMSEKLDPEEVSNIMHPLFEKLTGAINKFEGVVEKFIGDAIMALFGVPLAHEDDPERAILAALDMGKIIQAYSQTLEAEWGFAINMRIGINVGTVVSGSVGDDARKDYTVMGDAINTAARMEQNARPGYILVTEEVYQLTQDVFEFRPGEPIKAKGKAQPLQSYEVAGLKEHRQRSRGFGQRKIRYIGSEPELSAFQSLIEAAVVDQKPRFVAVTGEAGMGKSRLVAEAHSRVTTEHTVRLVSGAATSYCKSFSYFLLQSLLKNALSVNESNSSQETQVILKETLLNLHIHNRELTHDLLMYLLFPAIEIPSLKFIQPERLQQQIFKALADFFLAYGKHQLLLMAIDDLHWSDQLSLDWLVYFHRYLHSTAEPTALVLSATYRSTDETKHLAALLPWDLALPVSPLDPQEALKLVEAVLAISECPLELEVLVHTLTERANGNPYYIEEVLKALINDGILFQTDNEGWKLTKSVKQLPLPNSIQRLIISRFDKLNEKLRLVLQMASAIGKPFTYSFLQHIQGHYALPTEAELQPLIAQGFLGQQIHESETHYHFQQVLTQEIVYNTLLNKRKIELHSQLGQILEATHSTDLTQVLELLAHHFSRTKETAKSIRYLYLAAGKAARLCANAQALAYYSQALELLNSGAVPADLLLSLDTHNTKWLTGHNLKNEIIEAQADIYGLIGEYDKVIEICQQPLDDSDNVYLKARLYLKLGRVMEKRSQLKAALLMFEQGQEILKDNHTCLEMAKLWSAIGWCQNRSNHYEEALAACHKALAILNQTPDMQEIAYVNNVMGVVHYHQHQWEKALSYYQQSLQIQEQIQDLWGMGNSFNNMGSVHVMTNRWKQAIESFSKSLEVRERLGDMAGVATSCNNLGHIFQETGQYEEAIHSLNRAFKIQSGLKNKLGCAIVSCNLGLVYQKMSRWRQALSHLQDGLETLRELQAEDVLPEVINSMIEIHLGQDELDIAHELIQDVAPGIEKYGDPVQKGKYQRLKGLYYLKIGNINQVEPCLNDALSLLQAAGNSSECLYLYIQLYQYHHHQQTGHARQWRQEFDTLLATLEEPHRKLFTPLWDQPLLEKTTSEG